MKHTLRNGLIAASVAAGAGMTAVPAASADVVLSPQERVVVYRDLVADPYPDPHGGTYYYSGEYGYAQPRNYAEPPRDYTYVERRDYSYSAPAYTAPPAYYRPAPRWRAAVGAVVPREVVLQPVPETVGVPAVAGYDYAVIEDRVVLVEPASRRIFQVLQETSG